MKLLVFFFGLLYIELSVPFDEGQQKKEPRSAEQNQFNFCEQIELSSDRSNSLVRIQLLRLFCFQSSLRRTLSADEVPLFFIREDDQRILNSSN